MPPIDPLIQKYLLERQADVADAWHHALAEICFVKISRQEAKAQIAQLTEKLIQILISEPFEPENAQAIGADLVCLHCRQPKVLGASLDVLARSISEILSQFQVEPIQRRMIALLAEFATGFIKENQAKILSEQEEIRAAVETARRRAEEKRSQIEQRNRAILQAQPDYLVILDSEGKYIDFQSSNPNNLPIIPDNLLGNYLRDYLPKETKEDLLIAIKKVLETHEMEIHISAIMVRDQITHWESRIVPYTYNQVLMIVRDISETVKAKETLEQTNRQLQLLTRQLIDAQERERHHIALDLHDDVLSQLGAMVMVLDKHLVSEKFTQNYQKLTSQLRHTISGLRPPMLNFGLHAALNELCEDLSDHPGGSTPPMLLISPNRIRFDPTIELHLFRIVQQACENAMHHSQAEKITISGQIEADHINLTVEDNGNGFDAEDQLDLVSTLAKKHFGLAGMFERAALIDALLKIQSKSGEGTKVNVQWDSSYHEQLASEEE